jgi:predicted dehydrogenase
MRIGVIGCGMVSHAYCGTIARSDGVDLVALASRTMRSAEVRAAQYGGRAMSVEALLADPAVDLVVVLAPPALHHPLGRRVLEAGKHLYLEKPLATSLTEAADLLALAAARGLTVGCAPDTMLGEGHRRTRRLVEAGAIGRIVGGAASFASGGMEGWHSSAAFFYAAGGGPLLDIGPYYLAQLVDLLGPVAEVSALGATPRTTRVSRGGATIAVTVPTTVVGALRFVGGATVSLSLSWDMPVHAGVPLELRGTGGVLHAPDPNGFDGTTRWSTDGTVWHEEHGCPPRAKLGDAALAAGVDALACGVDPLTGGSVDRDTPLRLGDHRGLGVVEMVGAIGRGEAPRASGARAFHILAALLGLERSIAEKTTVEIAPPARL